MAGSFSRPKKPIEGLCKIFWIVDGVVRETINKGESNPVPFHVACWQAERASETTHKTGALKVVSVNEKLDSYQLQLNLKNK